MVLVHILLERYIVLIPVLGNLLFNGMEAEGMAGNIKTKEDYRNHSLQNISDNLETVLLKTGWDDAVVGTSGLQFNMDRVGLCIISCHCII